MKTVSLTAFLLCTLVAFGQTKRAKTPADVLYGPGPDRATWDGKAHGPVHVVSLIRRSLTSKNLYRQSGTFHPNRPEPIMVVSRFNCS